MSLKDHASGAKNPADLSREDQCKVTFTEKPRPGKYDAGRCIYKRGHDGPHYADFSWWDES